MSINLLLKKKREKIFLIFHIDLLYLTMSIYRLTINIDLTCVGGLTLAGCQVPVKDTLSIPFHKPERENRT